MNTKRSTIQYIGFALILPVAVLLLLVACDPRGFDDISGTVYFFDDRVMKYDLADGAYSAAIPEMAGHGREALCRGPQDTLYVKMETPGPLPRSLKRHVYLYTMASGDLADSAQLALSNPPYWCDGMQYVPAARSYLLSGFIEESNGAFELDSNLEVQRTLDADSVDAGDSRGIDKAFSVDSDRLLIQYGTDILVVDWNGNTLHKVFNSVLQAISGDRQFALFTQRRNTSDDVYEITFADMSTRKLDLMCDDILHMAYSPDDRYIAYNTRWNNLFDEDYFYLYDRQEDETLRTWVPNGASFIWVPE